MSEIHVSDHAVLRYLERIVGIDIDALRADIASTCARSNGAPCVRTKAARYLIRGGNVVSVLSGKTVPHFEVLADIARRNEALR